MWQSPVSKLHEESVGLVYPFFKVIGLWWVLWNWESARQTISGSVMNHRYMDQFEVKE
jgi:hypothetical protein